MALHYIEPETIAESRALGLDFGRAACGRVPRPEELTCSVAHTTCAGCLLVLADRGLWSSESMVPAPRAPSTDWVDLGAAAKRLRLSVGRLRRFVAEGALEGAAYREGRLWRIDVPRAEAALLARCGGKQGGRVGQGGCPPRACRQGEYGLGRLFIPEDMGNVARSGRWCRS